MLPSAALAQTATEPSVGPETAEEVAGDAASARADGDEREIVITGTRLNVSGFTAATPTTVLGEEDIEANAQPNVFTTIAQLPSLQGSTGTQFNTFSTSSGQQGLSSFSLRGVGIIRTLTLLDGQRVVGANVLGVPDISLFPQLLIKRVDIVNGGASASYGSDAVGGIVNFITDTHFKGIKGNIQGGITKYGDDESILVQLAAGTSVLEDRLHLVANLEYSDEAGIGGGEWGIGLANGRDWFVQTTQINRGVTNDGLPQFVIRNYAQSIGFAKHGLITGGPLRGIAFNEDGTTRQFEYGPECISTFCLGGDLTGNVDAGRSLKSAIERKIAYGRAAFEFVPDNEFYVSVNIAQVKTSNQPVNGMNRPNLTIQCENAFLPQSVKDACADAGITNFQFGTSNAALGNTKVFTDRRQYRVVVGLLGQQEVFGKDWDYDIYYQRGMNYTDIDVENIMLNQRFNRAIDAITLNGEIVCRDPVARASGCQPLNVFGGNFSQAAFDYVVPENGPFQRTRQTQDVASATFAGSPFDLWAGPLSIAFGAEWRHEYYKVRADPYGMGANFMDPTEDYPLDPVLPAGGNAWYAGNYKSGGGDYKVKEAFLEANLPLFDSEGLGKLNLNGAARVTDYSTSGTFWAWKVGGTWDTPLDGLRLRAVTSRDVRSPNLSELFAAPVTITLPNFFDPFTNTNVLVIQSTVGNPELKPEIARDTIIGATLANPSWLPGLSLSVDYYDLKINGVIGTIGANDIVRLCFENILPETCDAFDLHAPGGANFINVQPFNFQSIKTRGIDIEASYRWQQPLNLPGHFTVRALATHVIDFINDTGLPGQASAPVDQAGNNLGATPHWKWLAVQSYENDKFSFMVQERWFTDGTIGNQFVVCQTNCPVSTNIAPTIDNNRIKGAFYVDIGATYNVTDQITAYAKVDNLFDRDPEPSPIFNNPTLYDQIGRVYRAGVRFRF
jgi:outer membrane receptor protein involved in Fe transport